MKSQDNIEIICLIHNSEDVLEEDLVSGEIILHGAEQITYSKVEEKTEHDGDG